jgi:hypothetical protein
MCIISYSLHLCTIINIANVNVKVLDFRTHNRDYLHTETNLQHTLGRKMKVLIAVDNSNEAAEAFEVLMELVSNEDHVYLAALTSGLGVSCSIPSPIVEQACAQIEKQASQLLDKFAKRLSDVEVKFLMACPLSS